MTSNILVRMYQCPACSRNPYCPYIKTVSYPCPYFVPAWPRPKVGGSRGKAPVSRLQ